MGNKRTSRGSLRVPLCAYTARAESDISFRKGDRMEVLSDAEPDWWRVLHLTSRREGLVPANFVAEESSVECEEERIRSLPCTGKAVSET
ncbi:unnamed protein product [Leptidea sinapis]|uniref:SH3 domain-containing protein n=1 Tax=Leptidea sinapis TaxID=189913 RepID=A0A5E4QGY5_9NEOP|nr:unnamed protein product [Leptidea sinapis]